jgi:hypothetical protein
MVSLEVVALATLCMVVGFGAAYRARTVARWREKVDAVGTATPSEWRVQLTRIGWSLLGLVGVLALVVELAP